MNESIDLLTKILDCTAMRQRVLANNLANANTPNFKRMDVKFRDALAEAIDSCGKESIRDVNPTVVEDTDAAATGDGNTVSLQKEIGEMGSNALLYGFATKAVSKKLAGLSKAIKG